MKDTIYERFSLPWIIAWLCCCLVATETLFDAAEKWFWSDSMADRIAIAIVIGIVASLATTHLMLQLFPGKPRR